MNPSGGPALIAVDIGNSQTKFGLFDVEARSRRLPSPVAIHNQSSASLDEATLRKWLEGCAAPRVWRVASVNRPAAKRLLEWLAANEAAGAGENIRPIEQRNLPLRVRLAAPERVGIDRLLGAVGVNRVRGSGRPAIVIDLGTAITVDLISTGGEFLGGAILPGMGLSARALHEGTDALPLLAPADLQAAPPPLGVSTVGAMRSGLYWGAVGAMRELATRLSSEAGGAAEVYLTGGDGQNVAASLGGVVQFAPHLVLAGIAIAMGEESTGTGGAAR